jgi:hypothetical protein
VLPRVIQGELGGHTATLLPDGTVLVAGGGNLGGGGTCEGGGGLYFTELYDPNAKAWSATTNMDTCHYLHTATLLPSGVVLVVGGNSPVYGPTSELHY